jgi:hypothetical protein
MKWNAQPYINAEIFLDYVQTMFPFNRAELRRLDKFTEEMPVSLMENCSSHITSDVIVLLTEARVRVMTFAPQTTQIHQFLDMTLFGVVERRPRYELPFEDEKVTIQFIMKGYHAFKQTMAEANVWAVFQALKLAFEFDLTSEPYRLLFNEEKLRESASFREMWSIDLPRDQLFCQLDDVPLNLVGSISQSKMTWPNHIYLYFPLIRYQDIILCQRSETCKYREIHRISSRELQKSRLLMRN